MGSTLYYDLPYPEPGNLPDVPSDMQDLAEATDAQLGDLDARADDLALQLGQLRFTYHRITSAANPVTIAPGYSSLSPLRAFVSVYGTVMARVIQVSGSTTTSVQVRCSDTAGTAVTGVMLDVLVVGVV